jgi:hypothetical protein
MTCGIEYDPWYKDGVQILSNMLKNTGFFSMFIFGFFANIIGSIPWSLLFLFTQHFGILSYTIRKKEECLTIQKNLGACSQLTDGKASGYSVGYWYLAHVSTSDMDDTHVWLIATKESYETLSKQKQITISFESEDEESDKKPITVLDRYGSNTSVYYRERSLKISVTPRPIQKIVLNDINELLLTKKSAVVLLHGPPNVGKTMLSLIAANELGGSYCNSLSPWEPGDSITGLYNDTEVCEKNPLIVALDEVDSAIEQIHKGISPHKDVKIRVRNKAGWNKMLDEIQKGFYPHLVIIMTTNKTPEFFNELDSSYMAPHRVDKIYKIE